MEHALEWSSALRSLATVEKFITGRAVPATLTGVEAAAAVGSGRRLAAHRLCSKANLDSSIK